MDVFYDPAYVHTAIDHDTTRKAAWVASSLSTDPIPGVCITSPCPLNREQVLLAHSDAYYRAIETGVPKSLAQSNLLPWNEKLLTSVLSSNGGMLCAAQNALEKGVSGTLSSGLHHAHFTRGRGYCTFNGLAIAALELQRTGQAERILILDLDAHGGGGTFEIVQNQPGIVHVDVATSRMDASRTIGDHQYYLVTEPESYLVLLKLILQSLDLSSFDLCLYNAGMDVFEYPLGINKDVIDERERLVFDYFMARKIPVAFALAGGYIEDLLPQEKLVDLHRLTIGHAARVQKNYA